MFGGQIAHAAIRLPADKTVIDNHGNEPVGIQRHEIRRIVPAVFAANIFAVKRKI